MQITCCLGTEKEGDDGKKSYKVCGGVENIGVMNMFIILLFTLVLIFWEYIYRHQIMQFHYTTIRPLKCANVK